MITNFFTLLHCHRPLSLHMFCTLYHTILQCFLPSFLYVPMPIVKSSHNNSGFSSVPSSSINCINTTTTCAFTTPYPNVYIVQFKGLALLVVCLLKLHVINLVIKITCKRSYLCLVGLSAWITTWRSFFSPFSKLLSAQFCRNVVCLHGDVFFLLHYYLY